jgi:hypothetical protein
MYLNLQRLVSEVSEILILLKPSYLKLKTADTGTPKYQKFWHFSNPLYLKYT